MAALLVRVIYVYCKVSNKCIPCSLVVDDDSLLPCIGVETTKYIPFISYTRVMKNILTTNSTVMKFKFKLLLDFGRQNSIKFALYAFHSLPIFMNSLSP